jgi:hypothetical protein
VALLLAGSRAGHHWLEHSWMAAAGWKQGYLVLLLAPDAQRELQKVPAAACVLL